MKYQECTYCRRANSNLCTDCHSANLLLVDDTRRFYYRNNETDTLHGPVMAYLLPYFDVWPESYVWTKGMDGWGSAGNVVDRRTLSVSYDYYPCCNGVIGKIDIYPDEREILYKCSVYGFNFYYGVARMCSSEQM